MTVKTIFETMEYGTAPESPAEALGWLAERDGRFGHFIDGAFTEPAPDFDSRNPASGAILARLSTATQADVDRAVNAARRAQPESARRTHYQCRRRARGRPGVLLISGLAVEDTKISSEAVVPRNADSMWSHANSLQDGLRD